MRLWAIASAAAGLVFAAAEAESGPLFSASWRQSLQGVDVTVTNSGATCTSTGANLVQQSITCPGAGLSATGSYDGGSYSVSLTMPLFSLTQFTTGGAINVFTRAQISGSAVITGNGSMASADQGIPGVVTVKVVAHVAKGANASQLVPAPTTLLKVPLSVGKPGTLTGYFYVLTAAHYITVNFYGWTPGTRTFTGLTSKYAPLATPTVVAMGSNNLAPYPQASKIPLSQWVSASSGGTLTLVSPSKISIDGPLAQRRTVSFTSLTLAFIGEPVFVHGTMVPEPATLLLLGAGAAGLLLARRHAA